MDTNAPPLRPEDLTGFGFFRPLQHALEKLHELHPDPKRKLFYDQYLVLLLLAYYNPALNSLRMLQHAAQFPCLQKNFKLSRFSLGSFSEAAGVFRAEPLREIFLDLARQVSACDAPPRPAGLSQDLSVLAVDGTLWSLLPRMAREFWAAGPRSGRPPGFKAHMTFNVFRGVPVDAALTDGYASERQVLAGRLVASALYLFDSGYIDYTLFQNIIDIHSHFLTRARTDTVYQVLEERKLTKEASDAGVTADLLVQLGSAPHAAKLKQPLRIIKATVVLPPPHNLNPVRRHGRNLPQAHGQPQTVELVLITSLLDLPAELLLQLYRYRWQIEIFFRWFKCVLHCEHFFSESFGGMELQMYAALIATLLVYVYTGRRPNKRLLLTMQFYLIGWASWEDVEKFLATLKPAGSLAAAAE